MSVIARFYCASIAEYAHAKEQRTVTLQAVSSGERNKVWSAYTPSGKLEMSIRNPTAAQLFVVGQEYEIRIDRVQQD